MTKFTKILVAVAMLWLAVVQATPLMAQQAYDFTDGQLYYKITDTANRKVAVVPEQSNHPYYDNYNKPTGAITIHATVVNGGNTYSVTSIGASAFYGCSGLTSISIPNSVTSIGQSAFYRCRGLTSITIPSGVTKIESSTFSGCSGLTSITIPNSVTSIGMEAFYGCSGLTSITIPSSVTSIGKYAFSGCSGLTSITIPNSVTSIGYGVFFGCSRLTSIVIPTSCEASIATGVLAGCSGLTSITIPSSVTSIDSAAFYGCSGLTSINIPSGVTSIGQVAFYGCSGLTSINIPSGVTSIGQVAFYGCSGLTSINIPSSVTSIGEYAFYGCSGLTSINIPNGIKKLECGTFSRCTSLSSITIPEGLDSFTNKLKYFGLNGEYSEYSPGAFDGCSSLTSINIPSSVKFIGQNTFKHSGLISINIPNSVTMIENGAFSGCTNLTSINILNGVTSLGSNNFCSNPYFSSQDKGVFEGCTSLTSINIPSSVKFIGRNSFNGCTGLTSVTIPSSVTTISNGSFSGCTSLNSITIPTGVDSLGDNYYDKGVFEDCTNLTSINIQNGIRFIGKNIFKNCSRLSSVTIPGSVTSIGEGAFYECSGLTSITIPSSVTKIGNGTFYRCTSLASVNLSHGLDSIGSNNFYSDDKGVFEDCTSLTSISIPSSVTSIGTRAFYGCSGLTSIAIPNGTISIGRESFKDCSGLTSIAIPGSVMSIGYRAFAGCTGLTAVAVGWQTPLAIDQSVFDGVTLNRVKLIVPAGRKGIYRAADVWKKFSPIVEPANYTITYNQSAGGIFKIKKGTQDITSGSSVMGGVELTVEATPNIGYQVDSIKVNGIRITGVSFMVQGNTTVEVFWGVAEYMITYNQSAGGTFRLLNGSQEVTTGSDVTYGTVLTVEATPNTGYKLDIIKVNGTRISGVNFTVTSNSTVEVVFGETNKSTVTYSQSVGGTLRVLNGTQVVASGSVVNDGTVLTVEATPAPGYRLDSIRVNGTRIAGFTFTITSSSLVEAYFSKPQITVSYTQSVGGTLRVLNGSQEVASGSSVEYGTVLTFEATAAEHYKFDSIRVNGTRISGLSFTVTDNTNIEVFFGKQSYTVTYNSNMYSGKIEVTRGSEIVASGSSVEYGTQLMVRAIPNHGFEVKSLTINDQAIVNNFVFSISEPVEIKAVFVPATTALDEATTEPLTIYPNPVAEVLYLSATARTIRIYDMYGTEVAHATDTDKVEVSHLPAGVYTVRADGSIAKMIKR